jgi:hypothetical protein
MFFPKECSGTPKRGTVAGVARLFADMGANTTSLAKCP